MSGFSAFCSHEEEKVEKVKNVDSDRFIDEKGEPSEWKNRAIT